MTFGQIMLALVYLLAALFGVCAVRAAYVRTKKPATPLPPPLVDEDKANAYAARLSDIIQCQTIADADATGITAGSGDARATFAALRAVLEKNYPQVHKTCERMQFGDALLYRWPGKDSAKPALVLMSHQDVVPAGGEWKYPPFSGEIAEGCVWGRGTVDTKGSLCAIFEAVEGLVAEGYTPACDVYISSSCNEEVMGGGAPAARDWLREKDVKLGVVSDEGGAVIKEPLPGLDGFYAMLGTTEKGYANVRFSVKSAGGHASTPPKGTPLAKLAAFIVHMEKHPPFQKRMDAPVRQMFETLAPHMHFGYRIIFANLWLFMPLLAVLLPKLSAEAAAMVATTCVFTKASGSPAANVIPDEASVTANLRFSHHQPMEASLAAVRAVAEKYGVAMDVEYAHDVSPITDIESAAYRNVAKCAEEVFTEAVAAPYVMLGGTDARHFAVDCPCTVRFAPTAITAQQRKSVHGINENLGVTSLYRAVQFYEKLVRGM